MDSARWKERLPDWLGRPLRLVAGHVQTVLAPWRRLAYHGRSRYCPICRAHLRRFLPYGRGRPEARCPVCRSLERHRLIWLYLRTRTTLFTATHVRLLHIAPERVLSDIFSKMANVEYLSADLRSPRAMVRMDITDIHFPTDSFDAIYCSHVLEHVPDDRKALREIYRVLRPGGWAILQVPIKREITFEDPSATTPEDRRRLFGRPNHVRYYGPDYEDRLKEAGFVVTVDRFASLLPDEVAKRLGVIKEENVYSCVKPLSTGPTQAGRAGRSATDDDPLVNTGQGRTAF